LGRVFVDDGVGVEAGVGRIGVGLDAADGEIDRAAGQ
jgi:hypothetical protein